MSVILALSGSRQHVIDAIAVAIAGDTVRVDGTGSPVDATWVDTVSVESTLAITLEAIGDVTIRDGMTSSHPFLRMYAPPTGLTRLKGFKFRDGGRSVSPYLGGLELIGQIGGDNQRFVMSECDFTDYNVNFNVQTYNLRGVIHHCTFSGLAPNIFMHLEDPSGYGADPTGTYGDGSWSAPVVFGSDDWMFIENCTFEFTNGTYAAIDTKRAGRVCPRYNTVRKAWLECHGSEEGYRNRGGRAYEGYENDFYDNANPWFANIRSGTALFYNNRCHDFVQGYSQINLVSQRNASHHVPWGAAYGNNPVDVNYTTDQDGHTIDGSGRYFTGTTAGADAAQGGLRRVQVTGASWSANEWVGYQVNRTATSLNEGTYWNRWSQIKANGTDTIDYDIQDTFPTDPNLTFASGDSLEFRKVQYGMDQPGRGQGGLWTPYDIDPLEPPVYPTDYPAGWNDQVNEPCYESGNTHNEASSGHFAPFNWPIQNDLHYKQSTMPDDYEAYTYPHPLNDGLTAPVNLTPPVITGVEEVGGVGGITAGTYSGSTPITKAYRWQKRC